MHRLVLACVLVACSHPAQSPPATPAASAPLASTTNAPAIAPQLFTLEQLKAGNPVGRALEIRVEADGKPTTIQRLEFTANTDEEATIHATVFDDARNVMVDATAPQKWTDIYKHGQFPAAVTTIEDNVEVTVPAGTFKTRLYTVTEGDTIRRFWFAANLPGPPVQFMTEQAGKVVLRAQMLRAQ